MASSNDSPVLEGFICPICKSDRGTAENLLSHFQDEHSEEQDLIKTFRDLLDKAKKKILKQETFSLSSNDSPKYSSNNFEFVYEPQEIGVINSHTSLFNQVREDRLQRLAVPTNQLIIRLEKLLDKMPSDPQKRKIHEQNIVPWIDGSAVPRCPNCAGSFHLARRQHHCRLCGSVMCNDCSHFMDISTAMRILDRQVKEDTPSEKAPVDPQQLRLCIHCIGLLEVREEKRMSLRSKPIISQFYERLAEYRSQAEKLNAEYMKMANSLNSGESTYSLKEAQVTKVKLLRLSENIDVLSSKISVLGIDSDNPPQGQALRLQNMIRSACTMYLREQALSLPNLPTEEELERIQHRRREKITAKIQEEKMKRHARMNSGSQKPSTSPSKAQNASDQSQLSMGQGWVPESNKKANEMEDPLIEQMNIIRIYIKEAKLAQKTDEVASLEENLQELKKEFWRKQQCQDEIASRSGESSEAASLSSYDGGNKTASESISSH
ncbi:Rabenosyn Rab Hypothetical protein domain [Nesidiocoris tenuis]|uniref:FYVE-type domain-containing protein n=1 Tax=Nesidiocoris tenuis TaxID=355587 RepID=A0ABN7BC87_9HEMI|nr:Rabenosyn Rab Hypothetical protein domain [Nesidiocoris tenuis]